MAIVGRCLDRARRLAFAAMDAARSGAKGTGQPTADQPAVRASPPHQTISGEVEARSLAERLASDTRARPAIVITTRPSQTQPFIDPYEVRESVGDGADIFFLANDRSLHAFVRSMPERHGLEWSNARIYWPNFKLIGRGEGHPLIREHQPDPVGWLRDRYHGGPRFDLSSPGGKVERKASELSYVDRISALTAANGRLTTERDQAKERATRLERKVKGQRDRRTRQAERDGVTPQADVDREFREEIFGVWLELHAPAERHIHPLRGYRLGRKFLGSVDVLPPDVASRLPRVCAVVLCGRAHEVGDYEPHQLGSGSSSGSGVLVRSRDGAVAMRCRVAGSHRLHWWACSDASVELASVVPRDRHEIPED
jgi:hypothetical protein